MPIESRITLKSYFETGDIPTEAEFGNLIDSFLSLSDDGVTAYRAPGTSIQRIGIGVALPPTRLAVKAQGATESLISLHNSSDLAQAEWGFNLLPGEISNRGFNIAQVTAIGSESRLFIQGSTGNIGVGTILPQQKLHVQKSTVGGVTGLKTLNPASAVNQGWVMGHRQDAAERNGALSFIESDTDERMVILAGGNVGVNETSPDTKLHVSRPLSDPFSTLDLIEGTGIMVVGPLVDNIVADYQGIQARHGEYVGSTLNITASTLNLQRMGGDILIHGDTSQAASVQGILNSEGKLGLGTLLPAERIDIDGAIKISNTTNNNEGTIRYNGSDFQGRKAGAWVSLTAGNGPWSIGLGNGIYYDAGTAPRVSIGTDKTNDTLTVENAEALTQGSISINSINKSTTTSTGQDDNRVGIQISNTGLWGGDPLSKDIGIYVSGINGQAASEANIAAVLNNNVVIGDVGVGQTIIGTSGKNVLAIQKGVNPTAVPGLKSVQLYAAEASGNIMLHIMDATGNIIKLYKESALTPINTGIVGATYNGTVMEVINNTRTRLEELELKLQALGILA